MSDKKTSSKDLLQSPKGMHDIMGDDYYRQQGFFEKAQEIAVYYGFQPIETPILEKEELFLRGVGENTDIVEKEMYNLKTKGGDKLVMRPEGTAAIMRAYIEHGMQTRPQPVMLYNYGPFFRHEKPQRGRYRQFKQFNLEMLGTPKSIADAIIIRTTIDILEEIGFKNLCIDINSIGDGDSRKVYTRELVAYYKKHIKDLCVHCKERIKTNPLRLLDCKHASCIELKDDAPDSLGYLSPESKKHFKEVLEYLDSMDIPYNINKTLVRGLDYYTRTVFEIMEKPEDMEDVDDEDSDDKDTDNSKKKPKEKPQPLTLAAGGRYDGLAKTLGHRKPIPGVGVGIGVDRVVEHADAKALNPRIIKKPKMYFIQLGFEAKLGSLAIIEILRKAHVPIAQSLSKDGIGSQLSTAEKLGVPYTIIFGQKEVLDKTVIIRNMKNHSQDTVKIEKLAEYIKKMK